MTYKEYINIKRKKLGLIRNDENLELAIKCPLTEIQRLEVAILK